MTCHIDNSPQSYSPFGNPFGHTSEISPTCDRRRSPRTSLELHFDPLADIDFHSVLSDSSYQQVMTQTFTPIPAKPTCFTFPVEKNSNSFHQVQMPNFSNGDESSANISSFIHEYNLLENVLRKDDGVQKRRTSDEAASGARLVGTQFYLGDNLMEDGSVPQECLVGIGKSDESVLYETEAYGSQHDRTKGAVARNNSAMELHSFDSANPLTDVSAGFESFCDSNESGFPGNCSTAIVNHEGISDGSPIRKSEGCEDLYNANQESMKQFGSWLPYGAVQTQKGLCRLGLDYKQLSSNDMIEDVMRSTNGCFEDNIGNTASVVPSPVSDISTSAQGVGSHPDLYENLNAKIKGHIDRLKNVIGGMPRRKLRESLAFGVTIEDVEPLMVVNRDELAGMLGLGVTTWKMFVHNSLGVPRWPARALKSEKVKESKALQKVRDAESEGELELCDKLKKEYEKVKANHAKRRKQFKIAAQTRREMVGIKKKRSAKGC